MEHSKKGKGGTGRPAWENIEIDLMTPTITFDDKPRKVIKHHSECESYEVPIDAFYIDGMGIVWRMGYQGTLEQITSKEVTAMVLMNYAERMRIARDAADVNLKPEHYGEF